MQLPGENAQAVAELTFGLLLCLLRRIHRSDRWVREGEWPKAGRALPEWITGQELWKKTLGIIGLGQIGSRVAKIANGFEMKILAYDPFIQRQLKVHFSPLEEVLSRADILTLHLPLTPATEKMIDARASGSDEAESNFGQYLKGEGDRRTSSDGGPEGWANSGGGPGCFFL